VPSAADPLDAQIGARLPVEHAPHRAALAHHQQRGDVEVIGPLRSFLARELSASLLDG
jgi:hypothetical protein